MHNLCPFWVRNEDGVGNSEEYVYNRKPSGYFYAKEANAETNNTNIIVGSFMADQHMVMLKSADDLRDITENSIVRYNNCLWRVESIQKEPIRKESEFCSEMTYYWYLQLIR